MIVKNDILENLIEEKDTRKIEIILQGIESSIDSGSEVVIEAKLMYEQPFTLTLRNKEDFEKFKKKIEKRLEVS